MPNNKKVTRKETDSAFVPRKVLSASGVSPRPSSPPRPKTSSAKATAEAVEPFISDASTEISSETARSIILNDFSFLFAQQDQMKRSIQNHQLCLKKLITVLENAILNAPEGFLRINTKGKTIDYYYHKPLERGAGTYLPLSSNEALIRRLCQKNYDQKLLTAAKKLLLSLQKCSSTADPSSLFAIYDQLTPSRKLWTFPRILSDNDYTEYWKIIHRTSHSFREQDAVYYTNQNERVRSKSEVIIANTLSSLGIPYCYEPSLNIGGAEYRPDFIVLNVRTRKEYYWEHLGMMDDKGYVDHSYRKLSIYEKNGIIPGVNLILSFESLSMPLDTLHIRRLIKQFCQ